MKIAVIGASGEVGRRMVQEALRRQHRVLAIARSEHSLNQLPQMPMLEKQIVDSQMTEDLIQAISGCELMISAVRPPSGQEGQLVSLTRSILNAANALAIPVLITGGAARLKLNDNSDETVLTAKGFLPEAVIPIARACQSQFELCLADTATDWAYLSPPPMLVAGERTGQYRIGGDTMVKNNAGESSISIEDFAVAMLDEAEQPQHKQNAFTVAY